MDENERLRRPDDATAPTLAQLLLEIPQDDLEFERLPLPARRQRLSRSAGQSDDPPSSGSSRR